MSDDSESSGVRTPHVRLARPNKVKLDPMEEETTNTTTNTTTKTTTTAGKVPRSGTEPLKEPSRSATQSALPARIQKADNLRVEDYSEKAIVVLGATDAHTPELTRLGGSFNNKLRGGMVGWIFAKYKRETVEKFIKNPTLPQETSKKPFKRATTSVAKRQEPSEPKVDLAKIFKELKEAFDPDQEYSAASIIQVIEAFQEEYITTPGPEPMLESEDD